MSTTETPVICTIISKNYLANARCLADSFLTYHPTGRVFVLLVDEIEGAFDPTQERFSLILAKDLHIPDFHALAFRYFVHELNTAVKPFFLEYLFQNFGYQKLCYFDPDIQFFQPLDELFDLLDTCGILLLPHLLDPINDEFLPNELSVLVGGVYNLGFIGLAQHSELLSFLQWWQQRMRKFCTGEVEKGLFLDQRWIDLVPGLFSNVHIQRDPGYNVAYWNLNHRHITETPAGGYMVNGQPLKFYHFSGFNFDDVDSVARYQNRYKLSDLPALAPLYYAYRDRLIAHEHERLRQLPYAYGYFDNGLAIPAAARYLWRTVEDNNCWANPFATRPADSFAHWLNQPAADSGSDEVLITRLALEFYRQNPDLQAAFPDVLAADRVEFARWFVRQAGEKKQIDDFFVKPVRTSLRKSHTSNYRIQSETPADSAASERQLNRGGRTYLAIRDFLNDLGVGQPLRAIVGPQQVLKVRQAFIKPDDPPATLSNLPAKVTPAMAIRLNTGETAQVDANFGLNIVGYMHDETGVGEVARSLLKALHQYGFPVAYTNIISQGARQQDFSVEKIPAGHPYNINLLKINADQFPTVYNELGPVFFREKYNIGFWSWELAQFPEIWFDRFNYVDEIWVFSSFVQEAIAKASPVPVVNMRLPILPLELSGHTRADFGLPTDKHLFLFVFDALSYIERKNPFDVIEAYKTAFAPHFQDTVLVVKATNLHHNPDYDKLLREQLSAVSGIFIDKYLDRPALNSLFSLCDTYVSLHCAEGFGITIAESMMLGKSVIATGYSGNLDFMSPDNSYLVPYKLVEIENDYGPYQKGNVWAQPNVEEAARLMQRVVTNPAEAQQKGRLAQANIQRFYGSEVIAESIVSRLKLIHKFGI